MRPSRISIFIAAIVAAVLGGAVSGVPTAALGTAPSSGSHGGAAAGVAPAPGSAALHLGPAAVGAPPTGGPAAMRRAVVTGGSIRQLDLSSSGRGANDEVINAAVSPGGTMLAFWSRATNLYPNVTDGRLHLFVSELATGKVIGVVDTSDAGVLANDASTYDSSRALTWAPRETGQRDSRYIAFGSWATNLGPVAPDGGGPYLYVKTLQTGAVSLLVQGVTDAAWSPDGQKIAFVTHAQYGADPSTDEDIWSLDLSAPDTANLWDVSTNSAGAFFTGHPAGSFEASWAPDSHRVMFRSWNTDLVPNDTNGSADIFVKDINTGKTSRVSTKKSGGQANNFSEGGTWSPDGRSIAFTSAADNLVRGDTNPDKDVFVKNLSTGVVRLVSTTASGRPTLFPNYRPHWSPDGKRIAFMSGSVSLLPGGVVDNNHVDDVYVKNLATNGVRIVSITKSGRFGNGYSSIYEVGGWSDNAWLPGGRAIVFLSMSSNFARTDGNQFRRDVFLKTL
ncbi:hypothetical protein [Nocardioides sp.]|uniref:TolB family protein n=1 Tax=Nocardioides sp. TaxID=35761 RepID=UPI0026070437|nr:hypothetical protein [Nocardioides sp.]MDI6911694.1 hypothetical protein [Nocardioides sp.]